MRKVLMTFELGINCGGDAYTSVDGTEVAVTAVPDEGYEFTEWTGDLSGSDNPATITIDGDKSVTAVFEVITSMGVVQSNDQTNLGRNYPNPFSVETTIPYQLNEAVHVSLTIYNILGEIINTTDLFTKQKSHMEIFPNPFSTETTILYQLNEASEVTLAVYNFLE